MRYFILLYFQKIIFKIESVSPSLQVSNVNIPYIRFSGKDISIRIYIYIYIQSARKISHGDLSTGKSVRPGMEMAECNGTRYAWRLSTAKYHAEFHVSLSSKLQSSSRMRGVACKSGRRKAATFSLLVTSLLCYVTAFVRAWTEAGII